MHQPIGAIPTNKDARGGWQGLVKEQEDNKHRLVNMGANAERGSFGSSLGKRKASEELSTFPAPGRNPAQTSVRSRTWVNLSRPETTSEQWHSSRAEDYGARQVLPCLLCPRQPPHVGGLGSIAAHPCFSVLLLREQLGVSEDWQQRHGVFSSCTPQVWICPVSAAFIMPYHLMADQMACAIWDELMFSFQIKKTSTMFHISDKNSKLEKKKKRAREYAASV